MQYTDTHAHIYLHQFDKDRQDIIDRALEAGVNKIYMPNIDHESIDQMLSLEEKYADVCIPMMGLHPCSVDKHFEKQLYEVEDWLNKRDFVAVGEMGTDLYWDKTTFDYQKEAFKIQAELAIKHELPLVIHCRESIDETIEIVREIANKKLFGVFHCFTGTTAQAKEIIDLGFHLGLGGVFTFKNSNLREDLKEISLDHMVLETDSPYLSPMPHRGKRNEPAYIPIIAEKVAEVFGKSVDEVAKITSANAHKLFHAK